MTDHYDAYGDESPPEKPRGYDELADYKSQSSSKSWERKKDRERKIERYRGDKERKRSNENEGEMKRYKEYKEKERDRERDGEYKERDRGRYREYKDSERDRERESRHIERSRESEREIERERKHRSRSRERFGHRSTDIEISRERNKDRERKHRSRSRERFGRRSRDIERSRERNKDRERKHRSRSRERFGYRSRDIERSRERNRDRVRKHRSRSRERSGRRSRDIERYMDACKEHEGHIGLCQQLIEFYSVTIATNSSRHPYGTIQISDGTQKVIYNRDPDSSSCYKTDLRLERVSTCGRQVDDTYEFVYEIANLTAPARAKEVHDPFSIDFDLKSEDSPSPNKEVIEGSVDWDPYDVIEYDKVIRGVVKGEYGTACLYYAVFEKAFEAQIKVTLIHGDRGKSILVTAINAFNSCIRHKKILLYSEDKCQGTVPLHGIPFPLWRPTVVVPFDSTLTVKFDLVMLDEFGSNTIAKETIVFEPKPCGQTKKKIENRCGQIEINVTWFSFLIR